MFVSYARTPSRDQAVALHKALTRAGVSTFLDTAAIEDGAQFPEALSNAVLGARVAVVFAYATYFERWYCLRELSLLLAAYNAHARCGSEAGVRDAALDGIVVALPADTVRPADVDRLPPPLTTASWPTADQTGKLVDLVTAAVEADLPSFEDRLDAAGEDASVARRRVLTDPSMVPAARNLLAVPVVPADLDPSLGDGFVGRAVELWQLHYRLSTMRGDAAQVAAVTASVEGGGGFGKTRLAREYLWRFADAYPGGCFWVNADVDETLVEQRQYDIAKTLDPTLPELVELRERQVDARGLLADRLRRVPADRPVLFVVDNVPEAQPGQPPQPLDVWCPTLGQTTVLATSRQRTLLAGPTAVDPLQLETLERDAAVRMLTGDVAAHADADVWAAIADWVGGLPLALEVLNGALRAGATTPTRLHAMANQAEVSGSVDAFVEVLRPHVPAGAVRGITDALHASYATLTPAARDATGVLARFGPEPIPTALVDALDVAPQVRVELVSRSFVAGSASASDVELFGRMHRVIADFVSHRTVDASADRRRAVAAVQAVMTNDALEDPGAWRLMTACIPHAEHLLDGITDDAAAGVGLRLRLGHLLWSRGLSRRAIGFDRDVVEIARRYLGDDHPETLASMNNLAETMRALGDAVAARELHEEVLTVRRRLLGDDHPDTLTSMNNLAETLRTFGDAVAARELHEEVLAVRRRLLGDDHPDTLASMNNLAETLRALGDAVAARELHEEAQAGCRRLLGDDHPDTLRSMNNLALTRQTLGDAVAARELHEEVLAVRRRVLGDDHPDTLTSMNNLAAALGELGDAVAARELHEEALAGYRRVLGDDHPDTLTSMNNLALTLQTLGDAVAARELHEEALAGHRRVLGDDHPNTLASMNNLAETLRALGDPARARELHNEARAAGRGLRNPD